MEDEESKLIKVNEELAQRLREAEETLEALRCGKVDALIVKGAKGEQVYSLVNPDHPFQVFFENMDEAAIILSTEQIILYGNNNFFELMGSSSESVIGSSILDMIAESDRSFFVDCLQKKKKKKSELTILKKEGEVRTVLVSIFNGIWNEAEQVCLLFRDITELKRAQHLVRASESITKILSEAPQLVLASRSIIQIIYDHLGWEAMFTWLWNKEKQKFHCIDMACIEDLEIEAFKNKTRLLEEKSRPIFGSLSLSNRPVWIEDITEDSTFMRRKEAMEVGLQGALAFSFNQNSDLEGFVELFRKTPFKESIDNLMLDFISSIGIGLGLYIDRIFSDQIKFQFAKSLELSSNAIYSTNVHGIVINWYPGAEKMYGWTAEEMIGTSLKRLYPDSHYTEFDQVKEKIVSGNPVKNFESQRIGKKGDNIWVHCAYEAIYDFFGKISEIMMVEQDITNEKNLITLVAESNKKFDAFIEITEDWIWEVDKNGVFLFSNAAIYTILGYQVDEVLGKNFLYFLALENRDKTEDEFKEHEAKKEGWSHWIVPLLHKNGMLRWVETNAKVLLNAQQEFWGFRGSCRDITESKNLERIKNEFISIMSHELRTPMTSIYGGVCLLMSKELSPQERQELLVNVHKNSIRLTNLINDTMDFEKLQLGKLSFDFKKINLAEVVAESVKTSAIMAQKYDVKILIEDPLTNIEVSGDYSRLLQVLLNLLSNAIKFSPNGGVVRISLGIEGGRARVSVSDKGPGVPKDFQSKIFQSFAQADSSSKRAIGGTGLGLYLSKSIIEAHGGSIDYQTKSGEGTTFFFDLPLLTQDSSESTSEKNSLRR